GAVRLAGLVAAESGVELDIGEFGAAAGSGSVRAVAREGGVVAGPLVGAGLPSHHAPPITTASSATPAAIIEERDRAPGRCALPGISSRRRSAAAITESGSTTRTWRSYAASSARSHSVLIRRGMPPEMPATAFTAAGENRTTAVVSGGPPTAPAIAAGDPATVSLRSM